MKKRISNLAVLLLVSIGLFVTTGSSCRGDRLEPGGAYAPTQVDPLSGVETPTSAPDVQFFILDTLYKLTYSTVDLVFALERQNERFFWSISPDIKHTVDKVRLQAVPINLEFHRARNAYKSNPTPAGLATLETILGKMRQIAEGLTPISETMNAKLRELKANNPPQP